jgi:phage baseplate assembly protein gpV
MMTMPKLLAAGMALTFAGAVAGTALAQTPAKSPANKTTAAKSAAAPKAAVHSASGSIESYDASAHSLTLKTAKASSTFEVGNDTKVWAGSKSVTADELSNDTGRHATIKYSEHDGKKMATSVHVAAATPAKTKSTKSSK